jgi:hypothetical protein
VGADTGKRATACPHPARRKSHKSKPQEKTMPRIFAARVQEKATLWRFNSANLPPATSRHAKAGRGHPMVAIMQDIATAAGRGTAPQPHHSARHALAVPEDMQ